MSRDQLAADLPMAAAMLAGLAIPFAAALAIGRYVFHRGLGESTLQALGISFAAQRKQAHRNPAPDCRYCLVVVERAGGLAPILAILLVALDVTLPKLLVTSLQLLGSTTSGVSLFASGIILRALTPTVSI